MGPVLNLSNTSGFDLAKLALITFDLKKELTFTVNRARSTIEIVSHFKEVLLIDEGLRSECLTTVIPRAEGPETLFFTDLQGRVCYIDQKAFEAFTELARIKFPNLTFVEKKAVVDRETDIELMPADVADNVATYGGDNVFIEFKPRAWVAVLISTR